MRGHHQNCVEWCLLPLRKSRLFLWLLLSLCLSQTQVPLVLMWSCIIEEDNPHTSLHCSIWASSHLTSDNKSIFHLGYCYKWVGFSSSLIYKCIQLGSKIFVLVSMTTGMIFEAISSPSSWVGKSCSPSSNSAMGKQNNCLEGRSTALKPAASASCLTWVRMYEKSGTSHLTWAWAGFFVLWKSNSCITAGNVVIYHTVAYKLRKWSIRPRYHRVAVSDDDQAKQI